MHFEQCLIDDVEIQPDHFQEGDGEGCLSLIEIKLGRFEGPKIVSFKEIRFIDLKCIEMGSKKGGFLPKEVGQIPEWRACKVDILIILIDIIDKIIMIVL